MQGAGDLGVDAHTLEGKLRDVLEIARVWKAVVLIDEADIFLEARSMHEVARNAMVGVFLRTLEYQQGILFLVSLILSHGCTNANQWISDYEPSQEL